MTDNVEEIGPCESCGATEQTCAMNMDGCCVHCVHLDGDDRQEIEAARMKVRLRADPIPPIRQAARHACPDCGMRHFVKVVGP